MYQPPYINSVPLSEQSDQDAVYLNSPEQQGRSYGWLVIGLFIAITVICMMVAAKLLHILFPLASFLVGLYLYRREPILYHGFTWWIWFMVAFVRRIVDYRSGFTDSSPILLAPYLVSLISLGTVVKHLTRSKEDSSGGFLMPLLATFYGLLIGCILKSPMVAFRGFLDWAAPIVFGFHLLVNWRLYPAYRRNCQQVFMWGTLVMSAYGIVQFLNLPEWDLLWLNETGMASASGSAEEGGVRIWSTMHSAEPFAATMVAALLIMLSNPNVLGIPISIVGYVAFLICRVRSGWIGWVVGLLSMFGLLNVKGQFRLIMTATVLFATVMPLLMMDEFSDKVFARLDTLNDVQNDDSASGRQEAFHMLIGKALMTVVGNGLDRESMDNSILAILFYLGWIGAIPFLGGLLTLLMKILKLKTDRNDIFSVVGRGIVLSSITRLPVNGAHMGPSGALMWGFIALVLAADRYRVHEEQTRQIAQLELMAQLDAESELT